MPKETGETYGEMREAYRELPLGGFLSHLVTSFKAASYIAKFICEWLANVPYEQTST